MKIIEPKAELVDAIDSDAILRKLELCGRVSHQSESRGDSENFIRKIIKLGHESVLEHVSLTFHIICDRAIQNELVRHRHASFTVESTRYCKYDELEVIAPVNSDNPFLANLYHAWEAATEMCEKIYCGIIRDKYRTDTARAVLPLCLKSELYMTANLREWRHILKQRTAKTAHPQMRLIMNQVLDTFKKILPVIVEDIDHE